MRHAEGGWPKDVDPGEQADVTRFRKKVEKDEDFKAAVKHLGPLLARGLRQNNTVDIYEEYFAGPDYGYYHGGGGGLGGDEGGGGPAAPAAGAAAAGGGSTATGSSSTSSMGGRPAPPSSPRPATARGSGGPSSSSSGSAGAGAASSSSLPAPLSTDPPSAKGLAVFRDPCPVQRAATMLNWHPEGDGKLAVAYSLLNFQVCGVCSDCGGGSRV